MGTDKATFAEDGTIAHDQKWRPSRALSGSMFCACATGSCAIYTLVGPFDRKWQSHVTGRGPVRKLPNRSRFCGFPAFSRRSLDPFGVPLSVRNRKLRNTRSDRRSRDPLECSLRRPRPITLGNPVLYLAWLPELATHVLYLAWWLELALVICPFYFHIVSI